MDLLTKKEMNVASGSVLFDGVNDEDLVSMLSCLDGRKKSYKKDEYLMHEGDLTNAMGLVLSGFVHVQTEDYLGEKVIMSMFGPGQLFGEAFAVLKGVPAGVSVVCKKDSDVLWLDVHHVMTMCSNSCAFHARIEANFVQELAYRNMSLSTKLRHVTKRTTREKLMSYLTSLSAEAHCKTFSCPFNRSQLAEYLAVNRTAMSTEMTKMKEDGLIDFEGSQFTLL